MSPALLELAPLEMAPLETMLTAASTVGRQLAYASVVFAVVAVMSRLMRGTSPYLLYGLWALVPLRLVAPVDLGWSFGLSHWARSVWQALATSSGRADLVVVAHGAVRTVPERAAAGVAEPEAVLLLPTALLAAATLWSLASLWVALRGSRVRRAARAVLDDAARAGDVPAWLHDDAEALRRRLGVRRRVRFCTSQRPVSPFTMGSLRPVVFLPGRLVDRPELARAALAHELAHVARWDDLRSLVLLAARSLWAPFPLLHLAIARMTLEGERLCDALAASVSGLGARRYRRALVGSLRLQLEPLAGIPGLHPTTTNTRRWKMRIESLDDDRVGQALSSSRLWLERAALLVLAGLTLPMAAVAGGEEETRFVTSVAIAAPAQAPAELRNPLPGQWVTSPFGNRENPFQEGQTRHHDGIDLHADPGSRVLAPADGRVTLVTTAEPGREGMGTSLVLDHGEGLETYYAHLESYEVELGEWVRSGEVIAVPGSTGRSTGRHLHFEVWRHGEKVDPASFVPDWRD